MRYSELGQINRENVKRLKPAWTFHTGELEGRGGKTIECTPIVIDGVMYITTGYLRVVALDAATGNELWQFDPLKDYPFKHSAGVGRRQSGLCLLVGRQARRRAPDHSRHIGRAIVFARCEERQARPEVRRRGHPQSSGRARSRQSPRLTMGQLRPRPSGTIRLLSAFPAGKGPASPRRAISGHLTFTQARKSGVSGPFRGRASSDTRRWKGDSWKGRGGANAWGGFSVDTRRGLVFAGLGSAAFDFYGGDRHGDNLFANCTIALDARTGKRVWHFQTLRHDLWDHDLPVYPNLVTVTSRGQIGRRCGAGDEDGLRLRVRPRDRQAALRHHGTARAHI